MGAYSLPIMRYFQLASFRRFPSTTKHFEMGDLHGNLLAYWLRIPEVLVEALQDSHFKLPNHYNQKADQRGEFPIQHYATSANRSLHVFHYRVYQQDQPASCTWIQQNKSLCRYLVDRLRLIDPEAYNKLTNIVVPEPLKLLCHPRAGVAIN